MCIRDRSTRLKLHKRKKLYTFVGNKIIQIKLAYTLPASITVLDGETAADSRRPSGSNAALSSVTNSANAALSEAGPSLQFT